MNDFWKTMFLGNSTEVWVSSLGILLGGILLIRVFKYFFLAYFKKWSKKTRNTLDDFIVGATEKSVVPFLYFLVLQLTINSMVFPARVTSIVHKGMLIITLFYVLRILNAFLQYIVLNYFSKQSDGAVKQKQAAGMLVIIRGMIWLVGAVFLLDNLGYNVTTIIAGLGVGGIAIALAAQTILGDLFSYFIILFDRPFEIEDFIQVDDKMGVVEYIGIKTTRLRTLGGEQLIFSNKDLTDSRVHNYKRMQKRRVVFQLGVTYQTPPDLVQQIPQMVKNIIQKQQDISFDRGNFSSFGNFSLNFEFVYYLLSADYNFYMNTQETIYLGILRAFEKKNIEFAYPTQTLFLSREPAHAYAQ